MPAAQSWKTIIQSCQRMSCCSPTSAGVTVVNLAPVTATSNQSGGEIKTSALACFMLDSIQSLPQRVQMPTDPTLNLDSSLSPPPPVKRRSLRFVLGIVLMTGSFMVYPTYPIILLWLPLSASVKAGASVAVWVLSWATFSLGVLLAGPEGYEWFKTLRARFAISLRRGNPNARDL